MALHVNMCSGFNNNDLWSISHPSGEMSKYTSFLKLNKIHNNEFIAYLWHVFSFKVPWNPYQVKLSTYVASICSNKHDYPENLCQNTSREIAFFLSLKIIHLTARARRVKFPKCLSWIMVKVHLHMNNNIYNELCIHFLQK